MHYQLYKDSAQLWRWRLIADNGKTIADSGESYHNKVDCVSAIQLVKGTAFVPVFDPTDAHTA